MQSIEHKKASQMTGFYCYSGLAINKLIITSNTEQLRQRVLF